MRRIPQIFFNRPAVVVAKDLIGTYLCIVRNNSIERYRITETEAYIGPHDLASHASKGRTARTEVMFGQPSTIYVYFVYGMHYMLNIVTEREGYAAAVLIRGLEGIVGPGRVAKQLGIDKRFNGKLLGTTTGIWIEESSTSTKPKIIRTPRIGVAYAGPVWSQKKYRYLDGSHIKTRPLLKTFGK